MKQLLTLLAFLVCSNLVAAHTFNVRDYGAKGDGLRAVDAPTEAGVDQVVQFRSERIIIQ